METTRLHLPIGTRLYIKSAEGEEQIVTDKPTTLHVSDMKLHIDDDQEQSPVWDEHPAPTVGAASRRQLDAEGAVHGVSGKSK